MVHDKEATHGTRKHFSRRVMVQAKEDDDLADSTGNSAVDRYVVVFESLDDLRRRRFRHSHHVKTQNTLHISVASRERDQLFDCERLDHG